MKTGPTRILVLHHNGPGLLARCLPSVLEAARSCPIPCRVTVIDNASTDGSCDRFDREWPGVGLIRETNRGLASFNEVLKRCDEAVVLLLNNDVRLAPDSVEPLVRAVLENDDALFSAPQCWTFDGEHYEGMRTRVRRRRGLVQGMSRVPGHEMLVDRPDLTAAAGPVLAVHRERFLALGGYDPLYFPGRIEDLDLGFRGWMAGWKGYYVPESMAWHQGFGSFGPAFGRSGCDRLAIRNTFLFCWKNLEGPALRSHLAWLPARLASSALRGTGEFAAFLEAVGRLKAIRRDRNLPRPDRLRRQREFFERFAW
ncbi:MAG: glycosyltransferase [Isosphaeraceae bacterium]